MIGADFVAAAIFGAFKAFWPYILAALAALVALWKARRMGAASERAKQAERETAARDIRDQVQNDIGAMPADKVRAELAKRAK